MKKGKNGKESEIRNHQKIAECMKKLEPRRFNPQEIIATAREPMLILDMDLRVVTANRSFYSSFKVDVDETVGRLLPDLGNRQWDIPMLISLLRQLRTSDTNIEDFEVNHEFETIGQRNMLLNARKIRQAEDGPECILLAIEDVTERKRAVAEQEILRKQLIQAQKLESVGRLAGGMAHDFNNMLSIILGYGEKILNQLHHGDPLLDDAKEIVEAGKRSAALTRQLLAFSRRQTLQPEVLDLNAVVRNLEKMLRRLIGEDINLELSLSEDLERVMADPGQIEQVIMNLSVNARDAMPKGGNLIIETANAELDEAYALNHTGVKPGKYVLLAVTDTGCGMDKDVLSQIFDPFFTTKEKGIGTGLGLSTVYGIVKQSEGNIWAYSEPGRGTTFKIYLPQTDAKQDPSERKVEEECWTGGGEHILVVEDEESLRKLMKLGLSRLDYNVTIAANGGEALLLVEEKGFKPDLVITDVVMPNMSGRDLVDRLRRNQPDLKALYMSGYTDNAIIHHGVLNRGTPFIQKPFTIRDISEKVRAVLRGR